MSLQDMLDAQEQLQMRSYAGDRPAALQGTERVDFIKTHILALLDEAHEALNETGWKPWATSRHVNDKAFKSELIDAWHFMMNLFLVARMNADDIEEAYFKKRGINVKRQEEGYDGVSTKCPGCKRALDDSGVLCYAGGPQIFYCDRFGHWFTDRGEQTS